MKKEILKEAKRFMALSGIKEDEKKFLTNESFKEKVKEYNSEESEDDFLIYEFDSHEYEPGKDDHVYKINLNKKED